MDSFEINKVITAVLLVVLLVFGISKISDAIFEVKIAGTTATQASTESQFDVSTFLAMGNVEHGKKIFKKCAACHSINQDGGNKIGPKLWNVLFRPAGSIANYKYSKALLGYKKEWNWQEMNGFLTKPSAWIKGNKMGFAGLKKEKDRASVILYLNQNSDNPKPLP